METTGLAPETADNTASAAATEVDSEVATTDGAAPATAAADTGKPERDKVQERIDKLTRDKYEGLSRAERAEYRAEQAERRLAEREAALAKQQEVAPPDGYPTPESVGFDDAAHAKAVSAWIAQEAAKSAKAAAAAEREAAEREQFQRDWERRQAAFMKSKPEYADKVGSLPPSLMTDQLADVIKDSPMGPEVAFYLAENLEKLEAISQLSARSQAREIGRIEAALEAKKAAPPPVSKAPPPAPKIEASNAVVEKDPSTMTDKQFAKWRKQHGG